MKKLLLLLAFFGIIQFTQAPRQGIKGQVFWISGDQMPGPGKTVSPQQGIVREVLAYERVMFKDVSQEGQFIQEITAEPAGKAMSKADGSFKIKLPPGEYSLFTREPQGLFVNTVDHNGCINCVLVKPKQYSWFTITIDYEAAY